MTAPSIGTDITTRSFIPGLAPISNFWDTTPAAGENPNPEGLAEYTNRNFLSKDTIFKGYPYPAPVNGATAQFILDEAIYKDKPDFRVYVAGETTDGRYVEHLTGTGYFASELMKAAPEDFDDARYSLDDKCFQDYAAILIPKAVGYGTALLDYFFRGQLEITQPERGVYALTEGVNGAGFSQVRLRARNVTKGTETMPAGRVTLVARYKVAEMDPFQGTQVPVGAEFVYNVATLNKADGTPNEAVTIPRGTPAELTFDFATPIPLWATDLTLQLVYGDRLGNETPTGFAGEEEAVAVGFANVSEPSPYDFINGTDLVCLNGAVVASGSDAALSARDAYGDAVYWSQDVFPDTLHDIFLKLSPTTQPLAASSSQFDVHLTELPPGSRLRFFYIADTAETTNYSQQAQQLPIDARDGFWQRLSNYSYAISGLANEEKNENGVPQRTPPALTNVRGLPVWEFMIFLKKSYPVVTSCSTLTAPVPLVGPVPLTFLAP